MKLYFKPGACSLASRIVLHELALAHDTAEVDTRAQTTRCGEDYRSVNPRGYVPALRLDDGSVLTENPAILQFLADLVPARLLAPPAGTLERVRLQERLNFVASELHPAFGPYFAERDLGAEARAHADARLKRRLSDAALMLADGREFLMGDTFSVADAYLFVVLRWTAVAGLDLEAWPALADFAARVAQRPAVQAALQAEEVTV